MRWLAALLLVLTGCASSAANPSASSSPTGAMACGDPATPATMPLRTGAATMIICDSGQIPWRPPQEILRAGLAGLMTEISALEPRDEQDGEFCTADAGRGFTLMFGYPDETVTSVTGDTGGCSLVDTGSGEYQGADALLADVIEHFSAARRGQDPPMQLSLPELDCTQGTSFGYVLSRTGRLRDATRAMSCWRRNAPQPGAFHVRPVSRADLRVLVRDARTHQVLRRNYPRGACDNFPRYFWQDLLIATTWGDVLVLRGICDEFLLEQPDEGGGRSAYWHPSPRAQRILNSLRR